MKKYIAIYDFDGTLTVPPLPKYLWIEPFGYENGTQGDRFLSETFAIRDNLGKETMAAYIDHMMDILKQNHAQLTVAGLCAGQETLQYNPGVDTFFETIFTLARQKNWELKNYMVTGGFAEYVKNLPLAKNFDAVYGAQFETDGKGNISGVKKMMTNALKIEAIKDILRQNGKEEQDCKNVVYIGDGITDQYAMDYVSRHGGKSIFVHQPNGSLDIYHQINKDGMVQYCLVADYRNSADMVTAFAELLK